MKYRKLTELETELLINQGCRCDDWQAISVTDDFSPEYVFDVFFIGQVRMDGFTGEVELDGGVRRHTGICHATIDTCTVGRDVYIDGVRRFLSHYDIGEGAVISDVGALYATTAEASVGRGARIVQCGTLCNLQIAEGVCLRNVPELSDLSMAPFKAVEASSVSQTKLEEPAEAASSASQTEPEEPAEAAETVNVTAEPLPADSGYTGPAAVAAVASPVAEAAGEPAPMDSDTLSGPLQEEMPAVSAGPEPVEASPSADLAEAQPVREEWDFMAEPDDDLAAGEALDDEPVDPAEESSDGGEPDKEPSSLDELYAGLPHTPRQTSLFDEWEEPMPTPILADTLQPGYSPVNEKFTPQADLTQTLQAKNLAHLSDGIGLNDRFLFTRELFKSNPQLYKECVEHVDACASRAEAVAYVQNTYDWKKASSAARKFMALISRRFPEK